MRAGTPFGVFQQKRKDKRRPTNLLQGLPKGVGEREKGKKDRNTVSEGGYFSDGLCAFFCQKEQQE